MKKKLFAGISALLLTTTLLCSCNQASQKLQFSPNWAQNTLGNTGVISGTETLTYEVSFEQSSFFNKEYFTVQYCPEQNGTYTTTLQANDEIDGYEYTTALSMQVKFTLANGESQTFTDSVTTKTLFKSSSLALQPVSSEKTVVSHTPKNVQATKLEDAFVAYDYTISTEYGEDGKSGTVTYTDRGQTLISAESYPATKTQSFEINTEKFTYLDNEQLLFAMRGLSSTVLSTERTVSTYDVSTSAVQQVKITPSSATSDKFSFSIDGTALPANTVVEYIPLSIKLNAVNEGAPIQAWYAKTTDAANNTYRNVLLHMQTSVSYNIGVLKYNLKTATFAK